MASQSVTLVELNVYERILPLVSGYLQTYATKDPEVKAAYDFSLYTHTVHVPAETILADLLKTESDVYGFSCYVWNMGLIKQLLPPLLAARPRAQVLLGGPQVVSQPKYLISPRDNLLLCNGEGEKTFANLLRERLSGAPDLARVRGLSFRRDGELVTTEPEEKILGLDEIPSPFLSGIYPENRYTQAVFETNRGCPFKCSFCFWGLGDHRVAKFDEERIKEELTWLSDHGVWAIFFADANFGMLPRDVGLAEHIVRNKARTGLPYMVAVNSAKNRPERLVEVAATLQKAGINTTQSIAVQSLDLGTLSTVDRGNIKVAAYAVAQEQMNERHIASYVELIWPLPGETAASFRQGVETMCEIGAQSFIIYPLLLLQNTTMWEKREEHGFVTVVDYLGGSPGYQAGEYELVVATREVDRAEHDEGLRFVHAVATLYNARSLYTVAHYLHDTGRLSFAGLFQAFADYCKGRTDFPYVARYEQAIADYGYCHWSYWGEILHLGAHVLREEVDAFVHAFAAAQPWWDETTQLLFELDLVSRPYPYSNTEIADKRYTFEHLDVETVPGGYRVSVPLRFLPLVRRYAESLEPGRAGSPVFLVDHDRQQMPFMRSDHLEKNYNYCYGVITSVKSYVPVIRQVSAAAA